jgi:hypothetical protein
MENIEKKRIESESELEIAPDSEEENVIGDEIEQEEEKKERIEIRSGFFVEIREASDLLTSIEKSIADLIEGEPTVEKLKHFLKTIKEFTQPLEELEVFLDKNTFDKQAVKELFFEKIGNKLSFINLRQRVSFARECLMRVEKQVEKNIEEIKERREIEERNQLESEEEKQNLEETKKEILSKVAEIKNSFTGFRGKKRKRDQEHDIDRRFEQLEECLEGGSQNPPSFKDSDLNRLVEKYKGASKRYKQKMDSHERSISYSKGKIEKTYKELKENYLDLLLKMTQEASSNIILLRDSEEAELKWRDFFNNEIANEFGLSEEDKERFGQETRDSGKDTRHLDIKSFDNIKESVALFVRHFHKERGWDTETVLEQMKRELEKVEETKFVNIGRKEGGLRGLLTEGKLKSIWEFPEEIQRKKARGGLMDSTGRDYLNRRRRAEKDLGLSRKNPISASLGSENGRDEYGAPVQYGEYMVVLGDDVYDRAVYIEGDSMNEHHLISPIESKKYNDREVDDRRILPKHASLAKALFNLHRYDPQSDRYMFPNRDNPMHSMEGALEYIEALITGGVSLEDVKEVIVKNVDDVPEDIKRLLKEKGIPLVTEVSKKENIIAEEETVVHEKVQEDSEVVKEGSVGELKEPTKTMDEKFPAEKEAEQQSSFTRKQIQEIVNNEDYRPEKLVDLLRTRFDESYGADAGVAEKYTIEKHTLMVMGQFEKYFAKEDLPGGIDINLFRTFLAMHDIGKPRAIKAGDKRNQGQYSAETIKPLLEELGFEKGQIDAMINLVSKKFIGKYLRGGRVEDALRALNDSAEDIDMSAEDFLQLSVIYYQCDAGSYTEDAGGIKSLDSIFDFNPEGGSMAFSPDYQLKIDQLKRYIKDR